MFDPIDWLLPSPVYLIVLASLATGLVWLKLADKISLSIRLSLLVVTAWFWVGATPGIANLVTRSIEGPPVSAAAPDVAPDGVILVLGSGSMAARNGTPRPRLDAAGWQRLYEGIRLWRVVGGRIAFTGGPPGSPEQSIAGVMRSVALEAGIPATDILVFPTSRTTYEDIDSAAPTLRQTRGRIRLVTSALHMPRALAVLAKMKIDVEPWPCDYHQIESPTWRAWLPDNGGPDVWSAVLHEIVGRYYYRLRGWAT